MANRKAKTKHRPIIVFGEDWGAHPSSTQHLINILNKDHPIIWLNSIGLRKPKLTWYDLIRLGKKLISFIFTNRQQKSAQVAANEHQAPFVVINPLVIPCADSWLSLTISKISLRWQLKLACKKLSLQDAIVWSSLPTAVDYLDIFNQAPCVYYCGDDFASLAGVDHKLVSKKETQLIQEARYIFTASEQLNTKFPAEKVVNLPHGVNYPLFNQAIEKVPNDLPTGKPIAGFYGSISTWLDQQLLSETISALPQWNFVFIGEVCCNIDALLPFNNVYFLGAKPHSELPQYIQSWNVAMLPFVDNQQIQMCNPLKLREYLASGTPIVATQFNALMAYKQHLQVASEENPFYQALLLASAEVTSSVDFEQLESLDDLIALTQLKQTRKASVVKESWENRAVQVQEYLQYC